MILSPVPMLLLRQRHLSNPEVERMENSPNQFPRPKPNRELLYVCLPFEFRQLVGVSHYFELGTGVIRIQSVRTLIFLG